MITTMNESAARYAIIFAADAGTTALYNREGGERYTEEVFELAAAVGNEAERRRIEAEEAGRDFYALAFAEQAANLLRARPDAGIEELFAAGQSESDNIAGY